MQSAESPTTVTSSVLAVTQRAVEPSSVLAQSSTSKCSCLSRFALGDQENPQVSRSTTQAWRNGFPRPTAAYLHTMANHILTDTSARFDIRRLPARHPSIAPEQVTRTPLVQIFFALRSMRPLTEQFDCKRLRLRTKLHCSNFLPVRQARSPNSARRTLPPISLLYPAPASRGVG